MKRAILHIIRNSIFLLAFLSIAAGLAAQGSSEKTYDDTKKEIQATFGFFPLIFQAFPAYALPGAWEAFKELGSPESQIPAKYRELIQLAVASQIPCIYCIYFHTYSAKMAGATDEEIKEAIAHGASTRQWSMILQGNQVDFDAFKKEVQEMMKYVSEHAKN